MYHHTQKSDLEKAHDIACAAREVGAEPDLSDWVNSAVSQWRDPDRAWRLQNPIGSINRDATALSRLTGVDIDHCLEVVAAAHGDSETAVRFQAICEFGKQLPVARRRTA